MSRILVVEDEIQLARLLELELEHEGYQAVVEYNGSDALNRLEEEAEDFEVVLLDIMIPEIDGLELCKKIRDFSDIPIVMLTAKDTVLDKVKALDIGADDYITKPFAIEELLARIRALLRRNNDKNKDQLDILKVSNLTIDKNKYRVKREDKEIELTKKEYDLLVYMTENEGIVLSREDILSNIWGYDYLGETNVVDVYIRYLRSKIDDPFDEKLIKTVRGVGYVLRGDKR